MSKLKFKASPTSVILRVKLMDSSSSSGAGKTGLAYNTSGLIISTMKIADATATAYTAAGSTIETIATLGTYVAPSTTKCRFKEISSTNHPGVYELQFDDTRFANTTQLLISISGATGLAQFDCEVDMEQSDVNLSRADSTLNLKSIVILNNETDGDGIAITGARIGIRVTGNQEGILAASSGSYSAIHGIAYGSGNGLYLQGNNAGSGIKAIGGATGHGIETVGGATSGDGIHASATLLGKGMKLTGAGAYGHGLESVGAGSYGCGIEARASDGDGIYGLGGGSHGNGLHGKGSTSCSASTSGLFAEGNDGATGSGIKAFSALGKDIDAAEIGTPTNLDGSGASLAGNTKDIFDNLSSGTVDANIVTIEGADATDVLAAQAQIGAAAALTAYDPPTKAEVDAACDLTTEDVKDTLLNKEVNTRHANQKPSQYTAGTGGNQETVNTTIDINGNVETETQV
jgi:hypothetical protein